LRTLQGVPVCFGDEVATGDLHRACHDSLDEQRHAVRREFRVIASYERDQFTLGERVVASEENHGGVFHVGK
jgi:hypothetical protein